MAERQYKIDIQVDDHGAAETIGKVSDAEDRLAGGATKLGTSLDTLSTKQKTTVADTRGMDEAFGRSTVSARDADQVLSDLAVSAGKLPATFGQVRGGLNDLAEGAGLTGESLGMLNAAGLVIGTAYASWKITSAIVDFTGLDVAIGRGIQTVRDWGTGSQEAGAKADTLALASQRAGREITDFNEALKVSSDWLVTWKQKAQEMNDAAARLQAPAESRAEIMKWEADIEKVRAAGVLPALTADIQSHNFSQSELAERYRISAGAIGLFARGLQDLDAWEKQNHTNFLQLVKDNEDYKRGVDEATAKIRTIEMGGDHAFSTLHQWYGELARDQKYANELADQAIKKLEAQQKAAADALQAELNAALAQDAIYQKGARAGGVTSPNDGSNERGPGVNQGYTVPINGGSLPAGSYTGASSLPGGDTRGGSIYSGVNYNPSAGPIRSFDVGGPTGAGGPAMLHPDEYVVPKDGALVKGGVSSAAAAASIIYLSIDAKGASFEDDRSLDRLADKIATRIGQRYVQRGAGG